jgi:hypothetical protein
MRLREIEVKPHTDTTWWIHVTYEEPSGDVQGEFAVASTVAGITPSINEIVDRLRLR